MNTVPTVSKQLENESENDWAQKQEGQVCSCALGWAENQSAHRMLTQPVFDGERAVGEDKVGWGDTENSWQNALTTNDYCAFLCIWGVAAQQGQGWSMTTTTPQLWSKFS